MADNPRAMATDLRGRERRWLRDAEPRLAFDAYISLDPALVRRAAQAFRLLVAR